jgi:hypothetical protein
VDLDRTLRNIQTKTKTIYNLDKKIKDFMKDNTNFNGEHVFAIGFINESGIYIPKRSRNDKKGVVCISIFELSSSLLLKPLKREEYEIFTLNDEILNSEKFWEYIILKLEIYNKNKYIKPEYWLEDLSFLISYYAHELAHSIYDNLDKNKENRFINETIAYTIQNLFFEEVLNKKGFIDDLKKDIIKNLRSENYNENITYNLASLYLIKEFTNKEYIKFNIKEIDKNGKVTINFKNYIEAFNFVYNLTSNVSLDNFEIFKESKMKYLREFVKASKKFIRNLNKEDFYKLKFSPIIIFQ